MLPYVFGVEGIANFICDDSVWILCNWQDVFFHCDGIVEIPLTVHKLLKAKLKIIHNLFLRL